jgi:hypothetical protein
MAKKIVARTAPIDRQRLRFYYRRKRGNADGCEAEFARMSEAGLANLQRELQADTIVANDLDYEIEGLWPGFDPDDPRSVVTLDRLLEKRLANPADVRNPKVDEIARIRAKQREAARREQDEERAEQSWDYSAVSRPRNEHRINFNPFGPLFHPDWGRPGNEDSTRFFVGGNR